MTKEPINKEQEICVEIFNDETIPTYNYRGVQFKTDNEIMDEIVKQQYIEIYQNQLDERNGGKLTVLVVHDDGESEDVEVFYKTASEPFERIRRITGYLVGTTDRWNTGKRAEEKDRVKHTGI